MKFSYTAYKRFLNDIRYHGYTFECFDNKKEDYTVICRHDIDTSLSHALPIAKIEQDLGIPAVYFVLVSTNFYNVFSNENRALLKQLKKMGHSIGLHFDASIYTWHSIQDLEQYIEKEKIVLETAIEANVDLISFHRPVKELFNQQLQLPLISAYEETYFTGYEYLSDSRRNWRREPYDVLKMKPKHIQLLTHPVWYSDENPNHAKDAILRLKSSLSAIVEKSLTNNITEYKELMEETH